ncbi:alpha/beta hydrolase [Microbacterium terregens]|uniref:Alpha/beta hydrolase n=1 Tax=Microbacterium terregens TaxID=69363 RepID=A0ABV5T206_9MICO
MNKRDFDIETPPARSRMKPPAASGTRTIRYGLACITAALAIATAGCTSARAHDPSPSPSITVEGNAADDAVAPIPGNPPVDYPPSWPHQSTITADGYLVNDCVPQELRSNVTSLTTSDGVHLSALVLGEGPRGVLLSHEQGYHICSFVPLAQRLAHTGYQVILPEYRNHGASEQSPDNDNIDRDGAAALAELHRRGAERVFIGGASCGGSVSAILAAAEPQITGLLVMSSPAQCGPLDAEAAISSVTAPTLMIVSPGDMEGALEREVRALYAASGAPEKELLIDESGYHGTDLFREAATGDQLLASVFEFITSTFD